jgi:mono/diheme cytochrome c family protein
MSFARRLAAVLAIPVLLSSASDGRAARVGQSASGQDTASVRPRMREHFSHVAQIRDAVIRADLEGVRPPAKWLAEQPQQGLPPSAQANVGEMQRIAVEVASAPDMPAAARGMARLAAACGNCHVNVQAVPTLLAILPKDEDATLAGRMRKHYRAAQHLYRGLIVPSTHSWNRGADALLTGPADLELKKGGGSTPEIAALGQRLHSLADQARKAETQDARSLVYGQMLTTCSECHSLQGIVPRNTEPH